MQFYVVTIFPEIFDSFLATSLVGKALESGLIKINMVDPRDFTSNRHRTVDDTPFGGGDGMVMKPEPIVAALESIPGQRSDVHRILLSPQGETLKQKHLLELQAHGNVVLVCGRYEGFDERIRDFVDQELSLGDFVLNGGEVGAMAVIDGVARLEPGVIGNQDSLSNESFSEGLLEYPQYTRPRSFRDLEVPDVLLSGDHEKIKNWRQVQMQKRTRERRPDLWARHESAVLGSLALRTYVALLHHPVYDRGGRVVTTAITNLDLHDIARSTRTYGLAGYFVVTPLASQRDLAMRILAHWDKGYGATYNEMRRDALSLVHVASDLQDAIARVEKAHGCRPFVVATSAKTQQGRLSQTELLSKLGSAQPVIILMGTGWGLTHETIEAADACLAPLSAGMGYNHLSVRSAAAILLDRFFGMREEQ
ncbi:MAG: tRNA (guanosine(37)-N1)-methyltransferase TrmD [Pseudomonadota bacterium]